MLLEELRKENAVYKELLSKLKAPSHKSPGSIRISSCKGYPQYYYRSSELDTEKYLPKKDWGIAKNILQQEYNETIYKKALIHKKKLASFLSYLEKNNLEDEYRNMPIGKKNLVSPIILPFEEYAKMWLEKPYNKLVEKSDDKLFKNSFGENMRSKSECIISEILHNLGIPFKHDYPVILKDGSIRYVDFVILHKRTRAEIYYEHFGLTGNPEYVQKMLRKINEYADINIILGNNFFFTSETEDNPLDTERLKKIIIANCC